MDFIDEKIEKYAYDHTQPESELLNRLEKETWDTLEIPQMLTGRIEGRFLKLLVQISNAHSVLEIGTFSGFGSLNMAEGLPDDGILVTCDIDPDSCKVARKYFEESPHGKKISLMEGPALESIEKLHGPIDLVFIDADKINYQNYFEAVLPKVRQGGLIVVDNVLWSGSVLNPKDESSIAIHNFNEAVSKDPRVEGVLLTVRDGIFCLRKK